MEENNIYRGECISFMNQMPTGCIDLVFADPPFNIGYKYDHYDDVREDYVLWCDEWMQNIHRVLKSDGTFWLAIGDKFAAELCVAAKARGFYLRNWCIWAYNFGMYSPKKFTPSHTHLLYFIKHPGKYTFNADDPKLRVRSFRQEVYNDARANPAGCLPKDVWEISRVAGTHGERAGFHGCQMPEMALERIIRACSRPNEVVFDPFSGSGTTSAVAKRLGRRWIACDISENYVKLANKRVDKVKNECIIRVEVEQN